MDVYYDLNTKVLWFGAVGSTEKQRVKIRQFEDLRIQFVRGTTPELLEVSATVSIKLKLAKEAAVTLTSTATFTRPAAATGYYTGTLSINTTQITTDLFDAAAYDDDDEIEALVELEWAPAADATAVRKSDDASIWMVRSVITGSESAATDVTAQTALATLTTLTALTGGTSVCLDAVVTVGVAVGKIVSLVISNEFMIFQLKSGTTAEDGAGIIRPDDYAATSNEKYWMRLL